MAFSYTGTGGLFTRLGILGAGINDVSTFLGTGTLTGLESIGKRTDNVAAQYQTTDQNLTTSLYSSRDTYRAAHGQWTSALQALMQATIVQMVNDYAPLSSQNLTAALTWLAAQMKTDAQTLNKPTVSETVTAGSSNIGNGSLVASVLGGNGLQLDYSVNETVTATCTADGQGSGTAGQETFTLTSPAAESNSLAWDWPLGSGISLNLNAVDATVDNSGGNLLQNGAFKQWTNATIGPDNWLVLDAGGGVGTTIVQASGANVYKGTYGLGLVGDASHTPSLSQPFGASLSTAGNAGGTTATLTPSTQYLVNFAIKVSAVPAAGVLTIDLTDGNNTTVNDAQGNANSVAIPLSGLTTSFQLKNVTFRTPAVNPTTGYRIRVRISTATSAGTTVYFGHLALTQGNSLYAGGPQVAIFSGATNFILGDTYSLAVSNNYAGKFQQLLERTCNLKGLGIQLPSSGTPTIADSLIA